MLELRDAAKNIVDAAYLLEEATDSIRRAGSVIRGPTISIQTIAKSLHQASSSLEVASSSLEILLNEFNRNGYKVDTSEDDLEGLDCTVNIKEEELSDQDENFTNSESFDPLASSQNCKISNEIEIGGFPEAVSVSITDVKDVKLKKQTSKELMCSQCQYKTNSKRSLSQHIKKCESAAGGDELCCSECDYTTKNKTYLRHHMNKHQEGKYKCKYCNYSTGYKPQLKIHVSSKHSRDMIKCDECDYKAAHQKYLVQHQKRMHRPNPYKCIECKFSCVYPSDLKIHVSSVHQGVRFQCPQCNQNYPFKGDLTTHIKTVHDKVRYPCQLCSFTTPYKFNLKNHLMKIHEFSEDLSKETADKIKSDGAIVAKDVIKKERNKSKGKISNKRKLKQDESELVSNPDDDFNSINIDDIYGANETTNTKDESSCKEMNISFKRTDSTYTKHPNIAGFANSTSENIASIPSVANDDNISTLTDTIRTDSTYTKHAKIADFASITSDNIANIQSDSNVDNISTLSDENGFIISNDICLNGVSNDIHDMKFEIVDVGADNIDVGDDNGITNIIVSNEDCEEVTTYILAAGSSDEWDDSKFLT